VLTALASMVFSGLHNFCAERQRINKKKK